MTPGCHTAPGALLSSDTARERGGREEQQKEGGKEGKERRGRRRDFSLPVLINSSAE